jgi:hypothetical protein
MVKLHTTLINNTGKKLAIYEESSNGAQTLVTMLHPKHVPTTTHTTTDSRTTPTPTDPVTTPTTNSASENSRSTQELPNYYKYSTDPNDSYATIRIWCDEKAVLGVSSDEAIDNSTSTIVELKDGVVEKQLHPRYEIAHNQHWNSRLLPSFIIHQFHKVIIQFSPVTCLHQIIVCSTHHFLRLNICTCF